MLCTMRCRPVRHPPPGAPDYHVQLTGHRAGVHFFLSFSDANRSALSMEAMRRDCPQCEHAGPSPCVPLRGHPPGASFRCRTPLARIVVLALVAAAVVGDSCCAVLVPVAPPGSSCSQKLASVTVVTRKQLPAPKPDHLRRCVSGFVIRAQPVAVGTCLIGGDSSNTVRCPASESSSLRSTLGNRPPIGLVSRCPVSSLSDTVHLI